jgi:hypothetical protein
MRQFIPEAEDIGVFLPPFYKLGTQRNYDVQYEGSLI